MAETPSTEAGGLPGRRRPLPAREAALRVLSDLRDGRLTARESIDALLERHPVATQDLALANELVMGVVRHRLTLARVLSSTANLQWKRTSHLLQNILLLGAYQIIWLDAVPAFAAVNEAVEQGKAEGGPRGGRFINAVLRQVLREIEHRRLPLEKTDAARAIPLDADQACQFRSAVLPDPAREPQAHLADATSNPLWMVSRWVSAFGLDRTRRICLANMLRPPITVRPNALRTDAPGLVARLTGEGVEAEATPDGKAVALRSAAAMVCSGAFRDGLFQAQDRSSMGVILEGCGRFLQPGQTVLDLCAGLGTKATQVAERMRDEGRVLASDRDVPKLEMACSNAVRLGLRCVETVPPEQVEATVAGLPRLDWILIDAPCSNTGVLARRPEARYRLNPRRLDELVAIQRALLETAARLARPGTRLVYSTCSIEPEENEGVTQAFAASHPGWRVEATERVFPSPGATWSAWRDGAYWVRWIRG